MPQEKTKIKITKKNGSFEILPNRSELRIMQLTDLHYHHYGWTDKIEMLGIRDLCRKFDVDLIIITGDMFGHRKYKTVIKIMSAFDKYVGSEFPWAFTWGNHDCENHTDDDLFKEFDNLETFFESLPNLYYKKSREFIENYPGSKIEEDLVEVEAYIKPLKREIPRKRFDGFYGGNYKMQVLNPDTKLPAWDLFLLNSRKDHHIPQKALDWMKDEVEKGNSKIPVLAFYHVPNIEYDKIWNEKIAHGVKRERVCFEKDEGNTHRNFKELGNVKGCFVGHDHVNDYFGELDGILYSYGRKSGKHGYGSSIKCPEPVMKGIKKLKVGGKLITLKFDGLTPIENTWSHISVFDDGSTWKSDEMLTWK